MKHGEKMLLGVAGSLAFCLAASAMMAESSGNPYQGIAERNVFGLKPPPPPPDPEANKPPPLKITLTGITTLMGHKRALMKTPPAPPKPGETAKGDQFYILSEGQRDGDLEVMQIDEKAGTVKVNNSGSIVTLTFEKDGPKLASSGPSAPGMPPPPPGAVPQPFAKPQAYTPPGGISFPTAMPSRPLRMDGGAGGGSGAAGAMPAAAGGLAVGPGGLSFGGSTPGTAATSAQPQPSTVAPMSPEEHVVLYEANRIKNAELRAKGVHVPVMPLHPLLRQNQSTTTEGGP